MERCSITSGSRWPRQAGRGRFPNADQPDHLARLDLVDSTPTEAQRLRAEAILTPHRPTPFAVLRNWAALSRSFAMRSARMA